jgi:hypothetical protein
MPFSSKCVQGLLKYVDTGLFQNLSTKTNRLVSEQRRIRFGDIFSFTGISVAFSGTRTALQDSDSKVFSSNLDQHIYRVPLGAVLESTGYDQQAYNLFT